MCSLFPQDEQQSESVGELQIFWQSQTSYLFMSDSLVEHEVKMTGKIQSIKAAAPHLRAPIIPVEMWGHNINCQEREHRLHLV